MSRLLAEFLGVPGPGFRFNILELEKASGNPAIDIRLSTEIEQQTQAKIREFGYEPLDITAEELYELLKTRAISDSQVLLSTIQRSKPGSSTLCALIATTISTLTIPKSCFALKHSVAKRLLKKNPPKVTLRKLGYRSLDSLLKRESITMIFAVASVLEPVHWTQHLYDDYKTLVPSDFETRDIELLYPKKTGQWESLGQELADRLHSTILVSKELGGVMLMPFPAQLQGGVLATIVLGLQAINDIRIHSAFCKLQQVKHNFGEIIANSTKGEVSSLAVMVNQPVPWHILQRYYSKHSEKYPLEVFEPHVQREDLQLISIEDSLTQIEPSLSFWQNSSWLGFNKDQEIVSLNIADVVVSAVNKLSFDKRLLNSFHDSVWSELMIGYLHETQIEENVIQQLDTQLVDDQAQSLFPSLLVGETA